MASKQISKKPDFVAPKWIEEALGEKAQAENTNDVRSKSASSSNWDKPLTDTQAVEISDYLITDQEAQFFVSEDEDTQVTPEPEAGPAWE